MRKMWGGGERIEILRHRTGILCKSQAHYDRSNSTFPSRVDKKIGSGGSLPATKFYPYIKSLAQEPLNYFYYQEFSVHRRTYAYACAYRWNLEKKLFPESIFINKLRWLINISHYTVVLVIMALGVGKSFILLLIKWSKMEPNVKPQTLVKTFNLTKPTPILSRSICSSHNFVGLSCVRNMHSLASLQRYEETANFFSKDYDKREIELSCFKLSLALSPFASLMASLFFPFCGKHCTLPIILLIILADPGEGPGGPAPLIFHQTEARRAENKIFEIGRPLISGCGWPGNTALQHCCDFVLNSSNIVPTLPGGGGYSLNWAI